MINGRIEISSRESRLGSSLADGRRRKIGGGSLSECVFDGPLDESRSTLTGFYPARGRQVTLRRAICCEPCLLSRRRSPVMLTIPLRAHTVLPQGMRSYVR